MLTAAMALESWKDLFSSREEPALDKQERLFSNRQLRQMLVPLFIEQILVVGLGLSDTFMVSFLGEAAVFGVALVAQVILRWETQTGWAAISHLDLGKPQMLDPNDPVEVNRCYDFLEHPVVTSLHNEKA